MKKDAGYLSRTAFGAIGSAGGHLSMGRAEINQARLPEGLLLTDNAGVERFVGLERESIRQGPAFLLHVLLDLVVDRKMAMKLRRDSGVGWRGRGLRTGRARCGQHEPAQPDANVFHAVGQIEIQDQSSVPDDSGASGI